MNLSCRLAEFPRTAGGGNSDGRQERRKGLVLGCTTTPRVLHSHGMKTGNGVVGTGQAVVGEKGNALASRCAHQGIIVWGYPRWYRPLSGLGWYGNGRVAVGGSDEKEGRFALVQDFMVGLRCCFARTISNMCYRTLLSSRTITTTRRCPRRPSTTFHRARLSPMLRRCQTRGRCGVLRYG